MPITSALVLFAVNGLVCFGRNNSRSELSYSLHPPKMLNVSVSLVFVNRSSGMMPVRKNVTQCANDDLSIPKSLRKVNRPSSSVWGAFHGPYVRPRKSFRMCGYSMLVSTASISSPSHTRSLTTGSFDGVVIWGVFLRNSGACGLVCVTV